MVEFKFPDIGEGISEGILTKWMVKAGDNIKEGESLCEVETDKVTTELPSPATGLVNSLKGEEGDTIYVGDVIVKIDTGDHAEEESKNRTTSESNEKKLEKVEEEENAGVVGALEVSDEVMGASQEARGEKAVKGQSKKVLATPVARQMAYDLGIAIGTIKGTGPLGRVMKADIKVAHERKQQNGPLESQPKKSSMEPKEAQGQLSDKEERIKLSMLRKTIGKRMTESFYTAPHALCIDEVDVTDLVAYREEMKNHFVEEKEIKITYLPFMIKAVMLALKDYPRFNAQLDEENQMLILKKYYNIGIAVDTPEGLTVPVIKDVDQKGLMSLMEESVRLSQSAKDKSLKLNQLKGSTFTITNLGSLGVKSGMPIINYPEVAIIGIGQIEQKPVVVDNEVVIRWMMPLSLSFDHRVLDGGDVGRFLNQFKKYIKDIKGLLLR
ncbi:catalytic domain of components of various dehydrogenase complexes [Alkaliphilus metalliredigens QYMF]|uniref:Dihydrolipoamide acetyltransferase component of pyruvate dehydrogenase complex n=1 Tax=Alkaliphilus metalliredigens (strain QYMF) TaxID=293826 RepID=A6TMP1_ALKMQ|nr:dihydrolipoamide acetyltransferase family protein [Alkaliphilus metalliredigens]ABR47459.1 catalytic domain of components of various dehydrogenase complexes [Alkaliphilus metalliredigens QYMF]